MCASLAGFEPATYLLVIEALYPLSYSETRAEGKCVTHSWLEEFFFLWMFRIFPMMWIELIAFRHLVIALQALEKTNHLMLRF